MKLDYFSTLEAVLRTGSLSAASRACHLTPSAVSMQMKQLEAYFGAPLFDRSGSHLRPTALAREVISRLQPALQDVERLRKRDEVAVQGEMDIGVIDSLQPSLMPRIMTLAAQRYPALNLQIHRGRSSHLTSELKAGRLDAVVVAQPEEDGGQRLQWSPLFRVPFVVIAPPLSVETDLHELFECYEWIRFDPESLSGRAAAQHVRAMQWRAQGKIVLQSYAAIFAMVNAGLGVSLLAVSDHRLKIGYPVRTLALGKQAPSLQFSLAMRPADAERRTHVAFRGLCEQAAKYREDDAEDPAVRTSRRRHQTS